MNVHFRPATAADTDAIAALWHAGWTDGHAHVATPELTALRDAASFRQRTARWIGDMRLAEPAGGGAILGFHLCKADEVNQFYLSPGARGTGLAFSLMADAEATLARAGHGRIWLHCAIGNDRARRFYEKAGFTLARIEDAPMETTGAPIVLRIWRMEKVPG